MVASLDIGAGHLQESGIAESIGAVVHHEDSEVARTALGVHLKFQKLIAGREMVHVDENADGRDLVKLAIS